MTTTLAPTTTRTANGPTAAGVLAARTLRRTARSPELVVSILAFPLLLMMILLVVFDGLVDPLLDVPYIQRLAAFAAAFSVIGSTAATAMGTHLDQAAGMHDRLRTLSIPRAAVHAGRVLGDAARAAATTVLVGLIALPLGYRFTGGVVAALAAVALTGLVGAAMSTIGIAAGLRASSPEAATSIVSPATTLLILLSSGMVPVAAYPDAAQPFVRANPVTLLIEILHTLGEGSLPTAPVGGLLAWTAGLAVLGILGCVRADSLRRR